jgi:hypothetical protein
VGLRAKVLGRMGWTTSPHPRAGALSCPSLAIYGPGSYGAPALRIRARNRSLARRVYTSEAPEWVSNSLWTLPRLLSGRAGAPILRRGLRFAPSRSPKPRRITRLEIVIRSTIVHAQEAAIPRGGDHPSAACLANRDGATQGFGPIVIRGLTGQPAMQHE